MKRHRFVVQSPLQVLMATEARQQLAPNERAELVVLMPGEPAAVDQVRRLVGATGWNNVSWSPRRTSPPLLQARFVKRLANDRVDQLSIGDAERPLMRHLANRHDGLVTVFDDGLGVERLCRRRRDPRRDEQSPSLATRIIGLDTREPERLRFFTMFDLDAGPDDSFVENDLSFLRARSADVVVDDERTLLLGGCFVELGVMSEADYFSMVRSVIVSLPGAVEFLPHRREAADKIQRLLEPTTATRSNLPGPVEWSILESGSAPKHVATFFSTAAYTLWRLFGERMDFTTFDLNGSGASAPWMLENDMTPFLVGQTRGELKISPLPPASSAHLAGAELG